MYSKYNFDQNPDRENTSCVKYDLRNVIFGKADVIPMWVADMDIPTPSFVIDSIKKRCNHPVLGYTFRDKQYNQAIIWWYSNRHQWNIKDSWIEFCPGVVSGLNHAIRAFTQPGDKIIIQPPVYHPFYSTVENNGRKLVHNNLIEENGIYRINFEELERLAADGAKMLILSNPHNPVGKVWTTDELTKIGNICIKHNVLIVSDEIHSDLVFKPAKHVSLASLNDNFAQHTVTFASASKTFNIAGLSSGFTIIPNAELMKKYKAELEASGAGMGNIFGTEALKAAFTPEGETWLNALLQYFQENIDLVEQTLNKELPSIKFNCPQGTYMLWVDFRKYGLTTKELNEMLIQKAGLGFNAGEGFGTSGEGFQRINIACSKATVNEMLQRLVKTFSPLEKHS